MDQGGAVELDNRHGLLLGDQHEVGQESIFLVVMFADWLGVSVRRLRI